MTSDIRDTVRPDADYFTDFAPAGEPKCGKVDELFEASCQRRVDHGFLHKAVIDGDTIVEWGR